ncbi:hypothetical protein ACF0H5_022318 [Mactra antiquata]
MKCVITIVCLLTTIVSYSSADSCVNRCFTALDNNYNCQCNTACERFNDCCPDYVNVCLATCYLRCGEAASQNYPCQCNPSCLTFKDCCPDYDALCLNGDTGTLGAVMADIWESDVNRFTSSDLAINSVGSKLFTYVNEAKFSLPTFAGFISLLDNFDRRIGFVESQSDYNLNEVESFLNTLILTNAMILAKTFLVSQGKVGTGDKDFENAIRELWFNLYPRSSSQSFPDSSGFEHVMVGEHGSNSVSGFHSWIQFYLEEKKGNLSYSSMVSTAEPDMKGAKFTWYGLEKSKGSFFLGTSPETDLAIYSVCALMHPNARCNFSLQGGSVSIQTWDIGHKAGAQIGSAYPAI